MNFTADIHAGVLIAKRSSQAERVLSEDDFEYMVDRIAEALDVQKGIANLSVGATIREGSFEITFTIDAKNYAEANTRAIEIFNTAHAYALSHLAERLGQGDGTDFLKASETRVAELVG